MGIGRLRERLTVQTTTPALVRVSSLTASGTTATATTASAHGYQTGEYVTVSGAGEDGYNGRVVVVVVDATTFTYAVSSGLSSPATGTVTATYASDAQGGRRETWRNLLSGAGYIWAEPMPLRTSERMQAQAMIAQQLYRFRVRARRDLQPKQRALWTPSWTRGLPQKTLEIHGVLPDGDGRTFLLLDCGETA